MKSWLIVMLVALIAGALGITLHQNYLEIVGIVLLVIAVIALLWSWVRLSFEIRPRPRRRMRRGSRPADGSAIVRRSRTEALHAMIFRTSTTDLEK